ncbi:uncharacterized protein V3H86_013732 isoform 1-T1 [Mergus octosetaceus]
MAEALPDAGEDPAAVMMSPRQAATETTFSLKCLKDKLFPIGVTVLVAALLIAIIALAGKRMEVAPPESSPPLWKTQRQEMSILPLSHPSQLLGKWHRVQGEMLLLCGGRGQLEQEPELLPLPRMPAGHHRQPGGLALPIALRTCLALLGWSASGGIRPLEMVQRVSLQQPLAEVGTPRSNSVELWDQRILQPLVSLRQLQRDLGISKRFGKNICPAL